MLLMNLKEVKKQFASDPLFADVNLPIYDGDKIGIVGLNGSGKTTFLRMLAGEDTDYSGQIITHVETSYMPQLAFDESGHLSGGEYTKEKLFNALFKEAPLMLLDEPTCNLDMAGITLIKRQLSRIKSFVLISHDEDLLASVCNKILQIKDGEVKLYAMGYTEFSQRISQEEAGVKEAYQGYLKSKRKIEASITKNNKNANNIKKAPSRMGNSEARLHKREAGERRAKVEARSKNMSSRLEQVDKVEKPFERKMMKIKVPTRLSIHNRLLVDGHGINKAFDKKVLLKEAAFTLENNCVTWLKGANGSGKSTLVKMIMAHDEQFSIAKQLKIGYFDQKFSGLDDSLNLIENIQLTSSRDEQEIRNMLGNFLFRRDAVYKPVACLSGGEKVRLSLAKMILSDINCLVLDEPTNYLDIETKHILQHALDAYEGAVLLISHDKAFGESVSDVIYEIKKCQIHRRQ